jgi:hypothetical protein
MRSFLRQIALLTIIALTVIGLSTAVQADSPDFWGSEKTIQTGSGPFLLKEGFCYWFRDSSPNPTIRLQFIVGFDSRGNPWGKQIAWWVLKQQNLSTAGDGQIEGRQVEPSEFFFVEEGSCDTAPIQGKWTQRVLP